jgi:hypothetical protein
MAAALLAPEARLADKASISENQKLVKSKIRKIRNRFDPQGFSAGAGRESRGA